MPRSQWKTDKWQALLLEAGVIIGSILLAFAIDAWWQDREERALESALLQNLRSDLEASQQHLEQWLAGNQRVFAGASELLRALRLVEMNNEFTISQRAVVSIVGSPTYGPTVSTVNAAVSSGQIEIIRSVELRNLLAQWQTQLEDTRDDEVFRREITQAHVIPALSQQIRLGDIFAQHVNLFVNGDVESSDSPIRLQATTELEGAIAHWIFYTNFIVVQLTDIRNTQGRILELIQ